MFKFLSKYFDKKTVERKSYTYDVPQGSFLEYAYGGHSRLSAKQTADFYRTSSSIATAVDTIADSFEQIVPVLKTQDNQFIESHEVLDLLRTPNGFNTWQEFAGMIARNYLLNHDSFVAAVGNTKRAPVELWAIDSQSVSPTEARDSYAASYGVYDGPIRGRFTRSSDKRVVRYFDGPLKEIYHIMGYSSRTSKVLADSPLESAALEARQQIQGRYHNLSMLNNGGRLSLIITVNDEGLVTDDEHQERKQRLKEDLGGPENAGGMAVISGADGRILEVGKSNKDMDYANLDQLAGQAIYQRYKIPLPLISTDASTFNNMATAIELLYDFSVLPLADTLLSGLSKFLLPRFGLDPSEVKITYNPDSINALKQRRLDELKKRKEMNLETINELRQFIPNREPVDGGDQIYQAANLLPINADTLGDR